MNRLEKISRDLKKLTSDAQIVGYWDRRQALILSHLNGENVNPAIALKVLYSLALSLNNKEKYSSIYHLYIQGYLSIHQNLPASKESNELKFELARGLHHNRKYNQAKLLFNELAAQGFDISRFEAWWDQSAFSSIREKFWVKTDLLPSLVRLMLLGVYVFVAIKTEMFLTCTTIFIIFLEIYESWWYYFKVKTYLHEFSQEDRVYKIKRKIFRAVLIEFGISLLIYPAYFLQNDWTLPLVLMLAMYFLGFHFGLNYYYLPKLIGELNREKARRLKKL